MAACAQRSRPARRRRDPRRAARPRRSAGPPRSGVPASGSSPPRRGCPRCFEATGPTSRRRSAAASRGVSSPRTCSATTWPSRGGPTRAGVPFLAGGAFKPPHAHHSSQRLGWWAGRAAQGAGVPGVTGARPSRAGAGPGTGSMGGVPVRTGTMSIVPLRRARRRALARAAGTGGSDGTGAPGEVPGTPAAKEGAGAVTSIFRQGSKRPDLVEVKSMPNSRVCNKRARLAAPSPREAAPNRPGRCR